MRALNTLQGSGIWYLLCLVSLALLVGTIAVLLRTLWRKREKGQMFLSAFNLLFAFALFMILMDCVIYFRLPGSRARFLPFELALFHAPWLLYAATELFCAILLTGLQLEHMRYRKMHLTPDAIRQAVNFLPAGICISDKSGTVRLSNLCMDELCHKLTGEVLSDANRLMKKLRAQSVGANGQLLVKTKTGEAWLFESESITVNGEEYSQLIARDVSERYRIIDELKEKNAHLQDLQRRMRAASELSSDMFVAEEQAKARVALHNQLGQVILMGRHYIAHPENTDPKLVYIVTQEMNRFLLGEAAQTEDVHRDVLSDAVAMAKSIGVAVQISGSMPEDGPMRELIAQAITECAANTVKHAEGNALAVELSENESSLLITVTNNGRSPKRPVAESGGLLTLRKSVEKTGGSMVVESEPAFKLSLCLPQKTYSERSESF